MDSHVSTHPVSQRALYPFANKRTHACAHAFAHAPVRKADLSPDDHADRVTNEGTDVYSHIPETTDATSHHPLTHLPTHPSTHTCAHSRTNLRSHKPPTDFCADDASTDTSAEDRLSHHVRHCGEL
jgi:hypothetical protein